MHFPFIAWSITSLVQERKLSIIFGAGKETLYKMTKQSAQEEHLIDDQTSSLYNDPRNNFLIDVKHVHFIEEQLTGIVCAENSAQTRACVKALP